MTDDAPLDVGRTAIELADEAIDFGAELAVESTRLDGGTTVVDLGVDAAGSLDAGLLLATLRRGGVLAAEVRLLDLAGHAWPVLEATTGHPSLAGRLAGTTEAERWTLTGPGVHGHTDPFAVVVAVGDDPIDEAGAAAIAETAGVPGEDLYVVAVAPGSTSWAVDAAASGLEAATGAVEGAGDGLAVRGALIETPLPTATGSPADLADRCRRLGGRVHLQVSGSLSGVDLDSVFDDGPAVVTVAAADGSVETVGATDEERLAEALVG